MEIGRSDVPFELHSSASMFGDDQTEELVAIKSEVIPDTSNEFARSIFSRFNYASGTAQLVAAECVDLSLSDEETNTQNCYPPAQSGTLPMVDGSSPALTLDFVPLSLDRVSNEITPQNVISIDVNYVKESDETLQEDYTLLLTLLNQIKETEKALRTRRQILDDISAFSDQSNISNRKSRDKIAQSVQTRREISNGKEEEEVPVIKEGKQEINPPKNLSKDYPSQNNIPPQFHIEDDQFLTEHSNTSDNSSMEAYAAPVKKSAKEKFIQKYDLEPHKNLIPHKRRRKRPLEWEERDNMKEAIKLSLKLTDPLTSTKKTVPDLQPKARSKLNSTEEETIEITLTPKRKRDKEIKKSSKRTKKKSEKVKNFIGKKTENSLYANTSHIVSLEWDQPELKNSKIIQMIRSLDSVRSSLLSCNTQEALLERLKQKDMPDSSSVRPFLSDQTIDEIFRDETISDLVNGDIIHVPFSEKEKEVVNKYLVNKNDDFLTAENCEFLSNSLHGRTEQDCRRYIEGALNGRISNQTFVRNEIVVFTRKESALVRKKTSMFDIIRRRESNTFLTKGSREKRVCDSEAISWKRCKAISSSLYGSEQTNEINFHPNPLKHKMVSGSIQTPNELILYDLKNGKQQKLEGHDSTITSAKFSMCGDYIVSAGFDGAVRVWDSENGALMETMKKGEDKIGHGDKIDVAIVYPDPHPDRDFIIASSGQNNTVIIWNFSISEITELTTPSIIKEWTSKGPISIGELAFGHNNCQNLLLCGFVVNDADLDSEEGLLSVWDIEKKRRIADLYDHPGQIGALFASRTNDTFLSASTNKTAVLWDFRTLKPCQTFYTDQSDPNVLSFSPDGRYILAAGTNNCVAVFDHRFSKNTVSVLKHEKSRELQGVRSAMWTNKGIIISGGEDFAIRFWDIRLGNPLIHVLSDHQSPINTIAISPDEELIASGADDEKVNLYSCTETKSKQNLFHPSLTKLF